MVDERKPDPDMPKSKAAKNQGNTLWAHLADIRNAWQRAPLTYGEASALLVCGGVGLPYVDAARMFDVHRHTMMRRYESGVGKLLDFLNGTDHTITTEEL